MINAISFQAQPSRVVRSRNCMAAPSPLRCTVEEIREHGNGNGRAALFKTSGIVESGSETADCYGNA